MEREKSKRMEIRMTKKKQKIKRRKGREKEAKELKLE